MRAIVFDTETTDLIPGSICQLSYIVVAGGLTGRNFFFTVDSMSPSAQAVHGFSMDDLRLLSNGKRFSDSLAQIESDFKSANVLIGHNIDFDARFMRAEFERLGARFPMRRGLCTMNYFTKLCGLVGRSGRPKPPKLSELCDFFDVSGSDIESLQMDLFGQSLAAHDARYDSCATYLCSVAAMRKKALRELFSDDIA